MDGGHASGPPTPATAAAAAAAEAKKTGRPSHPLWAHFHRGEKRNRYHYHAFCSYCVERYGLEHVAPTRGVSIDMLRHLEKCTNCPRKVVETIKEICGQRDAIRFDRYGKKKQDTEALTPPPAATSPPVARNAAMATAFQQAQQQLQRMLMQPQGVTVDGTTAFDPSTLQLNGNGVRPGDMISDPSSPSGGPLKRLRTDMYTNGSTNATMTEEAKVALLKLAVAAGLPAESFYNRDFQELLRVIMPVFNTTASLDTALTSILDPGFLRDSASRLAAFQLDRVKEGMLNSTIKGGLTLSVHCWSTLDLQNLVAFNLVNSNGDCACVSLVDMHDTVVATSQLETPTFSATPYTSDQLATKIEEVLQHLQEQNISVMGIVADTAIALNAARRVCAADPSRRSLLVVPCFSRLLSVLAGAILTHDTFVPVVSNMIEVASYFMNAKLLTALKTISGDSLACCVLPHRENWYSFAECLMRLLEYRDSIVRLCLQDEFPVPQALKELVLRDDQAFWARLGELQLCLVPLRESYSVFFQQVRTVQPNDKSQPTIDVLEDDLSAAHGLTLAHVMYQLARMTQQYSAISVTHHLLQHIAQEMKHHIDSMWRRYELPVMVLAFVFNFHLDTALLNMHLAPTTWEAIAQSFQIYYQRWFGQVEAANEDAEKAPETMLVTNNRVEEILDAFKLNQFPFDTETTGDYIDVSSFYSFVSDSHPEICALCCRMYALSLVSANVTRIVHGVGYVPSVARTTREPEAVELLLHVGFASSLRRHSILAEATDSPLSLLGGFEGMIDYPADALIECEETWQAFAEDWRGFVAQELEMDEFENITQLTSTQDPASALLAVKVPVNELFVETLTAMTVTLEGGDEASATDAEPMDVSAGPDQPAGSADGQNTRSSDSTVVSHPILSVGI
ncbi:hypothetical protein Poli38472_008642 [Pythium oligandrum]|uniref:BED-type domain-containing protein n=1 Tax=Pythium oligandrum TaxID=41045 RepID=A0A8K1FCN1_PYTOL|nr:hypothetical protein Poli38472_008642 [Pythium oligandrum]|eukprot:TMW55994.1 hypothetical protein Poli38472_008642 [Pythium oligandrum]